MLRVMQAAADGYITFTPELMGLMVFYKYRQAHSDAHR